MKWQTTSLHLLHSELDLLLCPIQSLSFSISTSRDSLCIFCVPLNASYYVIPHFSCHTLTSKVPQTTSRSGKQEFKMFENCGTTSGTSYDDVKMCLWPSWTKDNPLKPSIWHFYTTWSNLSNKECPISPWWSRTWKTYSTFRKHVQKHFWLKITVFKTDSIFHPKSRPLMLASAFSLHEK